MSGSSPSSALLSQFNAVATPLPGAAAPGAQRPAAAPSTASLMTQFNAVATPLPGAITPSQTSAGTPQSTSNGSPSSNLMAQFNAVATPLPGGSPSPALSGPSAPQGGFGRNLLASLASYPQEAANVGHALYEGLTNPEYEPKMAPGPMYRGKAPLPGTPPVPPVNIPGLTDYIKNTSTTSLPDYVGQGVGAMLPMALTGGEAGVPALAARLAGNAAVGTSSGTGAYIGSKFTPDNPQAGAFWGSLVGGLTPAGLGAAAAKLELPNALAESVPMTKGMQERYAANKITQFSPDAAEEIKNAPPQQVLPGSSRSAAQASQSPHLARLESALQENGYGQSLQAQQLAQGTARAKAITGLAPQDAEAAHLTGGVQDQFARDTQNAESIQNVAEQSREAAINTPLGKGNFTSVANAPDAQQAGAAFRTPMSAGDKEAQARTQRLYKGLDDRNPVLNMSPLADASQQINAKIAAAGLQNVSPTEATMYQRAQTMAKQPGVPWQMVNGFRTELNQAINGEVDQFGRALPSQKRLMALKSATDDAINSASYREIEQNPDAFGSQLAADAQAWKAARTSNAQQTAVNTGRPDDFAQGNAGIRADAGGTSGAGAALGATGADAGRFPGAAGVNGVAEGRASGSLNPAWTQDDADQYRAALKSHAQRMGLYWNKYMGKILATDPGGDFRIPDEAVVKHIMPGGVNSRKAALLVKAIAKERPEVLDGYGQAVALNLRQAAVKDGMNVDPKALKKWQENNAGMLSVFPDMAARVKDIQGAQAMVDMAAQAKRDALDKYQHKAIQSVLSGDDPKVAMQTVLRGSPQQARDFMNTVKDPDAKAGAQKAMVEHLTDLMTRPTVGENAEANVRSLDAVLRDPRKIQIISNVLGPQSVPILQNVARDWRETNTASIRRNPTFGSPTAHNLTARQELEEPRTWAGRIAKDITPTEAAITAGIGEPHSGVMAAGAALLDHLYKSFSANRVVAARRVLSDILTSPNETLRVLEKYSKEPGAVQNFVKRAAKVLAAHQVQSSATQ